MVVNDFVHLPVPKTNAISLDLSSKVVLYKIKRSRTGDVSVWVSFLLL